MPEYEGRCTRIQSTKQTATKLTDTLERLEILRQSEKHNFLATKKALLIITD